MHTAGLHDFFQFKKILKNVNFYSSLVYINNFKLKNVCEV